MKLCIITMEGAWENITWSGTPKAIIQYLEKHNIEISNFSYVDKILHYGIRINYGWGVVKKLLSKFLYSYGSNVRDPFPFWYRINANFFENEMRRYDVDAYLFMGEQCVRNRNKIKGKVYVYLDRMIGTISKYDEDSRIGKKWYIDNYELNDKKSLSCMDHIFTQNDWSKEVITSRYGIPESKVTNVGVGVNLNAYQGKKDYANHKILIVLRQGTEHYKGLDLLLDAFVIAKKKISDLTLHVVGTNYKQIDGVHYYYNQPRSTTLRLFQECSLYAMPALLEPNGITFLEALANKIPTIGLNRFAFPEFCGYGKYGFIVENPASEAVAEAIVKAFSDIKKLKQMGEKGQRYVLNKYTWENVTNSILKIIAV